MTVNGLPPFTGSQLPYSGAFVQTSPVAFGNGFIVAARPGSGTDPLLSHLWRATSAPAVTSGANRSGTGLGPDPETHPRPQDTRTALRPPPQGVRPPSQGLHCTGSPRIPSHLYMRVTAPISVVAGVNQQCSCVAQSLVQSSSRVSTALMSCYYRT